MTWHKIIEKPDKNQRYQSIQSEENLRLRNREKENEYQQKLQQAQNSNLSFLMEQAKYQIYQDNQNQNHINNNKKMQSSLTNIVTFANLHDMNGQSNIQDYQQQIQLNQKNNQKQSGQSSQFIHTVRNSNEEEELEDEQIIEDTNEYNFIMKYQKKEDIHPSRQLINKNIIGQGLMAKKAYDNSSGFTQSDKISNQEFYEYNGFQDQAEQTQKVQRDAQIHSNKYIETSNSSRYHEALQIQKNQENKRTGQCQKNQNFGQKLYRNIHEDENQSLMKEYKEQMEQIQYLQLKLEEKQHLHQYHPYIAKLNQNSSETLTTVEAEQANIQIPMEQSSHGQLHLESDHNYQDQNCYEQNPISQSQQSNRVNQDNRNYNNNQMVEMNVTNYEMFEEPPRENLYQLKPQQNIKIIKDKELLGGTMTIKSSINQSLDFEKKLYHETYYGHPRQESPPIIQNTNIDKNKSMSPYKNDRSSQNYHLKKTNGSELSSINVNAESQSKQNYSINIQLNNSKNQPSFFSQQLQKLYDNILVIYPSFGLETAESRGSNDEFTSQHQNDGKIIVNSSIQENSKIMAIQLYNQLLFLYQKTKEFKLNELKLSQKRQLNQSLDKSDGSNNNQQLNFDLAFKTNIFLKSQLESLQKEKVYYKMQVDSLKQQINSQQSTINDLNNKNNINEQNQKSQQQKYEKKMQDLKQQIEKLQNKNNKMSSELQSQQKILSPFHLRYEDMNIQNQEQEIKNNKNNQKNDFLGNIKYGEIREELIENTISFRKETENTDRRQKRQATSLSNNRINNNNNLMKQNDTIRSQSMFVKFQTQKSPMSDSYLKIQDNNAQNYKDKLKDLESILQNEKECFNHEKQLNKTQTLKFEKIQINLQKELDSLNIENKRLSEIIKKQQETNKLLNQQLNDFAQQVKLEFPIMIEKQQIQKEERSPILKLKENSLDSINLNNQRENYKSDKLKSQRKGFLKMTNKNYSPKKVQYKNDQIFGDLYDEIDASMELPLQKLDVNNKKFNGINTQNSARNKSNPEKQQTIFKQDFKSLLNFKNYVQQLLSQTFVTETVLQKLKSQQNKDIQKFNEQLKFLQDQDQQLTQFNKEKDDMLQKMKQLMNENEVLKVKFSQLLDQFQEYVNESEKKADEEQIDYKKKQEKLQIDLRNSINEYEELIKGLEKEIIEKDEKIVRMKQDQKLQDQEFEYFKERAKAQANYNHNEMIQEDKIQKLNEEVLFLKKHYMQELEAIKQENDCLRKNTVESKFQNLKSRNTSTNKQTLGQDNDPTASSPFIQYAVDSKADLRKSKDQNFNQNQHQIQSFKSSSTQNIFKNQDNCQINLDSSQILQKNNYNINQYQQQISPFKNNQVDQKNQLQNQQFQIDEFEIDKKNNNIQQKEKQTIRSKSQGRLGQNKHYNDAIKDYYLGFKNSCESLELKDQIQMDTKNSMLGQIGYREKSQQERSSKFLEASDNHSSILKQTYQNEDKADSHKIIKLKNKEIFDLRIENEELKRKIENPDNKVVQQIQRNRIISEIESVTETLSAELERIKMNLYQVFNIKDKNHQSQLQTLDSRLKYKEKNGQETMKVISSEQKLVKAIKEKVKNLHDLIFLTSDILLISSKQKYLYSQLKSQRTSQVNSPNSMSQINRRRLANAGVAEIYEDAFTRQNQDTINDFNVNTQIQRVVYKYESTFAQLDKILRRDDDKDQCIYDLKKLTEKQLHEIINLQQQIDQLLQRDNLNNQDKIIDFENIDTYELIQENNVLKQEIQMLREHSAQNDQLMQSDSSDIIGKNANFIHKLKQTEQMLKQNEKMLLVAQNLVKERDNQLQIIRQRITVVAELFEKKPIKQLYSFEVLCDFIHDKAKRLFKKYESCLKENKQKVKVQQLEQLNAKLEKEMEVAKEQSTLLRVHVVPKLQSIIGCQNKQYAQGIYQSELIQKEKQNNTERVNGVVLRQLMDEIEYQYKKAIKDLQITKAQIEKGENIINDLQNKLEQSKA